MRLSPATVEILSANTATIDSHTAQHGSIMVKVCFTALAGGAPQSLAPPYSDCVYAIITHVMGADADDGSDVGEIGTDSLAYQWVFEALNDPSIPATLSNDDKNSLMINMFALAKGGVKLKTEFRTLLSNFGKMCAGESSEKAEES